MVDPQYLTLFAKVPRSKHERMTLHFSGPVKPVLVTIGEDFRGVIMPIRIAGK
jgi:hypothetical protein